MEEASVADSLRTALAVFALLDFAAGLAFST
jgi:hypothetical protein